MNQNEPGETLRLLPSVDALLRTETAEKLLPEVGAKRLTILARTAAESLRGEIQAEQNGGENYSREDLLARAETKLIESRQNESDSRLRKVINATGVVIHTNLGRAPLSERARQAITETASGYCTLEYDLRSGKRGRRGAYLETLLAEITGAEAALIVNNCAAAAFLVLTALAKGGEVIISRGELVEIGGDFRIPEVMEQSGAILKEVGTTNRTKISDYERAVNENTRLFLKVHPSNYRVIGFTETSDLKDLATLARRSGVTLYEDAGSGAIFDLSKYGLTDEPVIGESIKAGADVVTFSGDKLLGGAQAGLIVGRAEIIETIRKHPLYRALRVDKLIYAALSETLETFRRETALEEIPVLRMLSATGAELKGRVEKFVEKFGANPNLRIELIPGNSVIGGGSAPLVQPPTTLLALEHAAMSADKLEAALRFSEPPIIARITEEKVTIDLRTVSEDEEAVILQILEKI